MSHSRRGKPEAFLCECGDHAWAKLSRGYVTLVSPDFAHLLESYFWSALPKPPSHTPESKVHDRVYATRTPVGGGTIQLHREILQPGPGLQGDHRDGRTLDNRNGNLRVATPRQNQANKRKPKSILGPTSIYKGVCWDSGAGRWRATIEYEGRSRFLGHYYQEKAAAEAYIFKAMEVFGDFARF